ncbi:MAG: hypothetical protein K0B02_00680 [DPANN group archaeon]|nr:hypothetical protein [DPANN group archaeon]
MKTITDLFKNWKMLLLIGSLLISIFFIGPHYIVGTDGKITIATNIDKGLDLEGGVRALLLPENNDPAILDEIISKLNVRVNAIGLTETKIIPVSNKYIQVEMAGRTEAEIRSILEQQGMFEAKINRFVKLKDNEGVLDFATDYTITAKNDSTIIIIDGTELDINDTIILNNIEFKYLNNTDNTITLSGLVYTGDDITKVFKDAQHSRVEPVADSYKFIFDIMLSKEAAEKFAAITKELPLDIGTNYLTSGIDLYLDGIITDSLKISESLRGSIQSTITISGPGDNREDAVNRMKMLQSILESGALPTKISIEKIDTISPTLGAEFLKTAILSIIFAIIAVSVLIFVRYHDFRIAIPIFFTSISEVIIILGFAAWIHWTIDLAAIAGIIAAVGTGIDAQIVITDEGNKKQRHMESLNTRLKNAFFIIFTAAATTIAAMVPLMFVGAGVVKGFAVTTILGVLIGVMITRPAYGKIIEFLKV